MEVPRPRGPGPQCILSAQATHFSWVRSGCGGTRTESAFEETEDSAPDFGVIARGAPTKCCTKPQSTATTDKARYAVETGISQGYLNIAV